MKAYDLLVQAESGLAAVTGRPEGPGRVGVSVCDIAAGMYAYAAMLEALIARGRSGEGRAIAVSLFDGLADWMTVPLLLRRLRRRARRSGSASPIPPSRPTASMRAADGREVVISIQNEREWRRLCAEVLEKPKLAEDTRFHDNTARVENRPALNAEIDAVFGCLSFEDLVARLRTAGIAYGAINGVAELSQHPQLRRVTVESPAGPLEVVAPPARVTGQDRDFGPVPALDQQGAALRKEFAE